MAILTISKLLKEAGLDTSKKIKLVRHKDSRDSIFVNGVRLQVLHTIGISTTEIHSLHTKASKARMFSKMSTILSPSLAKKELPQEWWVSTKC